MARRRLSADWQRRYGHLVWLVETFVEQERLAGTAHQAAGRWPVGCTTGRTRQDRHRTLQTPVKVGEAQAWNEKSVSKVPALMVMSLIVPNGHPNPNRNRNRLGLFESRITSKITIERAPSNANSTAVLQTSPPRDGG